VNTMSVDDPTAYVPMGVIASRETEVGFELEPIVKKVTLDKMRLYTRWPQSKSYHNDYAAAQVVGLKRPIILGNQVLENIIELLMKFFGQDYLGGNTHIKFIGQMHADDELTIRGVITDKVAEGDAIRLILDVWVENQHDEKVIVGIASGLVL